MLLRIQILLIFQEYVFAAFEFCMLTAFCLSKLIDGFVDDFLQVKAVPRPIRPDHPRLKLKQSRALPEVQQME